MEIYKSPSPTIVEEIIGPKGGKHLIIECHYCHNYRSIYASTLKHGGDAGLFCSQSCSASYTNKMGARLIHGKHWSRKKRLARESLELRGAQLNVCEVCRTKITLAKSIQFHHKDRNEWNNAIDNVEVLCVSCHAREHYKDRRINELGRFV